MTIPKTEVVINHLQQQFYQMLITKDSYHSFPNFVENIPNILIGLLKVDTIAIYLLNDITDQFQLYGSSLLDLKENLSKEELLEIVNNEMVADGSWLIINANQKPNSLIVPIKDEKDFIGFLFVTADLLEEKSKLMESIALETFTFIRKVKTFYDQSQTRNKYEVLHELSSKFSITMKMEDILEEAIQTLIRVYPFNTYSLLMEEYFETTSLPIKKMEYDDEHKASVQAYLNGQIQIGDLMNFEKLTYVPLKGKQGIYGVLEITTPSNKIFSEEDIQFVTEITNNAFVAFENARLYDQSKRLIHDLELINQSSQQLNSNMQLSDVHAYMFNLIQTSFDAHEIGFVFYPKEQTSFRILEESSSFFTTEEGLSFVSFINRWLQEQDSTMFIGDFQNKYPYLNVPYQSVMVVPMIHEDNIIGEIIVLHKEEYFFSFETFKLLRGLVQHSTLTVVNALLKEELETLVRTDYLTKLYSRKYLDETLNSHITNGTKGSFILIDIDNFKKINDQYGHEVGDQIILQVANIIRDNIRSQDVAARWGGEELAIYLPNTPVYASLQIAERLVERVSEVTNPKVTISCGISYWEDKLPQETRDIFLRADQALYLAKEQGKNQVVRHDEVFN